MHMLRVIGLGLACAGLAACDGTSPDRQRLDQLAARLDALEKRLAAAEDAVEPVDRLRDDIATLDQRTSALETSVRGLPGRPGTAPAAPPSSPPTTAPRRDAAAPPPGMTVSPGVAAASREERTQRRAELRALTDEFRARLAEMRQDRANVGNQEKTREILEWYREQRRAILRGEGRTD